MVASPPLSSYTHHLTPIPPPCSSLGVIFPPFLIFPRGVGKISITDGGFRICAVVTPTAIITDWGFTCKNGWNIWYLVMCKKRFLLSAAFLNATYSLWWGQWHHIAAKPYTLTVHPLVWLHFFHMLFSSQLEWLLCHSPWLPCFLFFNLMVRCWGQKTSLWRLGFLSTNQ